MPASRPELLLAALLSMGLSGCAVATLGKVGGGLLATQISLPAHPERVDPAPMAPGAARKHDDRPVYLDLAKMHIHNPAYHAVAQRHSAEIYDDFSLYTVEFDDQGYFWNRPQALQTVDCIMSEALPGDPPVPCRPEENPIDRRSYGRAERQGILLMTLVHGWKHGCAVCDDNLACWREQLELVARLERDSVSQYNAAVPADQRRVPRRVVGLYVGWRGKRNIWRQAILDDLDFVDRKEAAQRIGRTDGVKLFTELDARFKAMRSGEAKTNPPLYRSELFFFGHSFGGALLYTAAQSVLQEDLEVARAQNAFAPTLGDGVYLLNPAFEALLYENFHSESLMDASTSPPRDPFKAGQPPAMMNLTSRSDWVTHYVFPLGRIVFLPLQLPQAGDIRTNTELKPYLTAAGHLDAHRTHELAYTSEGAKTALAADSNASKGGWAVLSSFGLRPPYQRNCQCEYDLTAYQKAIETGAAKLEAQDRLYRSTLSLDRSLAPDRLIGDFELRARQGYSPNTPYYVVQVDGKLISSHGDIFNPNFIRFLSEYLRLYRPWPPRTASAP